MEKHFGGEILFIELFSIELYFFSSDLVVRLSRKAVAMYSDRRFSISATRTHALPYRHEEINPIKYTLTKVIIAKLLFLHPFFMS